MALGSGRWKFTEQRPNTSPYSLVTLDSPAQEEGMRVGALWHFTAKKESLAHPWFSLLVLEDHKLLREKKPWKFPSSVSSCFIIAIIFDLLSHDHLSRILKNSCFFFRSSRSLAGAYILVLPFSEHTLYSTALTFVSTFHVPQVEG